MCVFIRLFQSESHKFYSYYLFHPFFFFLKKTVLFSCKGKIRLLESQRIVGIADAEGKVISLAWLLHLVQSKPST